MCLSGRCERLLDAAGKVISKSGLVGASLQEIAAAAGLTKGAVYSQFDSKEDLLIALLDRRFEIGHALLRDDPFFRFERQVYGAVETARRMSLAPSQQQHLREQEELRRLVREGTVHVVFQPVQEREIGRDRGG